LMLVCMLACCYIFLQQWLNQYSIIQETVLDAFTSSIHTLLRGQTDKRTLLENLDYVLLVIDELIDDG
jgi:hypothetical protein